MKAIILILILFPFFILYSSDDQLSSLIIYEKFTKNITILNKDENTLTEIATTDIHNYVMMALANDNDPITEKKKYLNFLLNQLFIGRYLLYGKNDFTKLFSEFKILVIKEENLNNYELVSNYVRFYEEFLKEFQGF